jgi:4-cresol dehydrogenase (hydroxylating)
MSAKLNGGIRALMTSGAQELEDISGQQRRIRGVLAPQTLEDVQKIVRWASQNPGTQLQPISCGNNWGFGSHLPADQNAYILDLSSLNRIRCLALSNGYVELEPGVTQGKLDSALEREKRTHYFNVTGAGAETSILGNALERGIGYFGSRHEDLLDLEVVLTSGEIIHTGYLPNTPFHTGLGPNLTNLFIQSTLGIVTGAKVRLFKRPECMGGLLIKPRDTISVTQLVEVLTELQAEGHIRSVPHLGNKQRAYVTFCPYVPLESRSTLSSSLTSWTAVLPLSGTIESVKCLSDHLASRLQKLASCELICSRDLSQGVWIHSLLDLCQGIPSNIALPGVSFAALGHVEKDIPHLEKGSAGLIHVAPSCSPKPKDLDQLLALVGETQKQYALSDLPMTINLVNSGMAVVVISITFQRQNATDKSKAIEFAEALKKSFFTQGFLPYRLGLSDSTLLPTQPASRSALLESLRKVFDPQGILCRSKYERLNGTNFTRNTAEDDSFEHLNGSSAELLCV